MTAPKTSSILSSLLLCAIGLSSWTHCHAQGKFAVTVAKAIVKEGVKQDRQATRFCLSDELLIVDEREEGLSLTNKDQMHYIRKVMHGHKTGVQRNEVDLKPCSRADIKIEHIKVIRKSDGTTIVYPNMKMRNDRNEWEFVPTSEIPLDNSITDVPTIESTAELTPLKQKVRLSLADTTIARFQPTKATSTADVGGFGFQILVDKKPLQLFQSKKTNLFLANGVADQTVFQINLVNHYPFQAAALVRINGEPRMKDENGDPVMDYLEAATDGKPGARPILGFRDGLEAFDEFKLAKTDLITGASHHVEVEFRFAAESFDDLPPEDAIARSRSFHVERGNRINARVALEKFYVGRVREKVSLAFNHELD